MAILAEDAITAVANGMSVVDVVDAMLDLDEEKEYVGAKGRAAAEKAAANLGGLPVPRDKAREEYRRQQLKYFQQKYGKLRKRRASSGLSRNQKAALAAAGIGAAGVAGGAAYMMSRRKKRRAKKRAAR